jgi:hypothetical protein
LCASCLTQLSVPRANQRKKYCYKCELAVRKQRLDAAHDTYICKTYGVPPGTYKKLYEFQGGKCYICQRATGATRRLAMDHDHACCASTPTCGQCNRGLLCKPCNRLLGHARDDAMFFGRAVDYLIYPPARTVLFGEPTPTDPF